jgi:hypothetical protein
MGEAMKDVTVTRHNLSDYFSALQDELELTPVIVITTQNGDTGKWTMAKLWRVWMDSTGKFMAGNGCKMPLMTDKNGNPYGSRPFDKNDAHELFTRKHLGVDAKGVRLCWARKAHGGMRPATKGERYNALFKHEMWAGERGIILFKPRGSDYDKAEKEQVE